MPWVKGQSGNPAGGKKGAIRRLRTAAVVKALSDPTQITPLDLMLEAMRTVYDAQGAVAAMPHAIAVAPYLHPRLTNVDANLSGAITQYTAIVEARTSDALAGAIGPATEGDSARPS